MRAVGVIPARYGSTRLPGKPLAEIAGSPMLRWVWEGARRAKRLTRVIVATDDERVAETGRRLGAEVAMTAAGHPSGTHRVAEVAERLSEELVVNVQGDEPLIEGDVIDALVEALEGDPEAPMATVAHPAEADALDDPHRVKVVMDQAGYALYFSRSGIPALAAGGRPTDVWQHVGIYAYRREFLRRFLELPPTPAEQSESLEQLRALEHGHRIRVARVEGWRSLPVDVPADVVAVEHRLRELGRAR